QRALPLRQCFSAPNVASRDPKCVARRSDAPPAPEGTGLHSCVVPPAWALASGHAEAALGDDVLLDLGGAAAHSPASLPSAPARNPPLEPPPRAHLGEL